MNDEHINGERANDIPWLNILGSVVRRIILDDQEEMGRIRKLGARLEKTSWKPASGLKTTPYLENTPAGTARDVNTLWKGYTFYINEASAAKMVKDIAQELSKAFNRQEIVDAIKFCYEREQKFIIEYMEENFKLQAKEDLRVINTSGTGDSTEIGSEERMEFENFESSEPQAGLVPAEFSGNIEESEHLAFNEEVWEQENQMIDEVKTGQVPVQRRQNHVIQQKPKLFDLFAASNGYIKNSSSGNFIRKDGFRLEYASGFGFPWQEYSPFRRSLTKLLGKRHLH